ncbi:hypothetical protein PENTCL1PPCAC_24461, partial [Pristionchus entomophagus]
KNHASRKMPSRDSNSSNEEKEMEDLQKAEDPLAHTKLDLSMADPQTRLLYFAKKEEWKLLVDELGKLGKGDFSTADQNGYTALLLSVKNGQLEVFEQLISKGADISQCTKDGRNAAHMAAMYSGWQMLDAVLTKGPGLLSRPAGV